MAWFQVDDQLAMHRKVCEAGNAAMGLWVRAGAWSMANLTEGFVPKTAARTLGTAGQAAALVKSGLWVEVAQGYQFHEWGTRQMSAEQIAERRRKRAEAGRKGGQSKSGSKSEANTESNAQAIASERLKQNGTPVPVPVLVGVTWEGNGTSVDASDSPNTPQKSRHDEATPPDPFCAKHMPDGTDSPCGPCGTQRERRQRWDAEAGQRTATALAAFWAGVRACDACDDSGFILESTDDDGLMRCPKHDWSLAHA